MKNVVSKNSGLRRGFGLLSGFYGLAKEIK